MSRIETCCQKVRRIWLRKLGCTRRKTIVLIAITLYTVCGQYREGLLLGNLCEDLCNQEVFIPDQCQAMHFGKDVVFTAKWRDKEVFIKSLSLTLSSWRTSKLYTEDSETGAAVFPEVPDFERMLEHYLADNMAIRDVEGNIVNRLWGQVLIPDEKLGDKNYERTAMENVWALVQNQEYVFSRLFEHYDVFPEVYGSCGSYYIVEKVRPLSMPSWLEKPSFREWVERVSQSLKIIDLLEEMDSLLDEPLLACDVKAEHFGLSQHGRVKLLDTDALHFESIAARTIYDTDRCTTHSDCDYLDCRGRCDLIEEKCAKEVTNDNLQLVCEEVFLGHHRNFVVDFPGLLTSKHMHNDLRSLLHYCANPSGAKDTTRIAAGKDVKKKLKKRLKEVIDVAKSLNSLGELQHL